MQIRNIEEGESGLELGERKPPAHLVAAVPELRRYRELIRVVRHRMGLNEGAGKGAGFLVAASRAGGAPERVACVRPYQGPRVTRRRGPLSGSAPRHRYELCDERAGTKR